MRAIKRPPSLKFAGLVLAVLAVVSLVTLVVLLGTAPATAPEPGIAILPLSRESHHFVTSELRARDPMLEAKYQLKNLSRERQILALAGTSCGCIGVSVDDHHVKPGDKLLMLPRQTAILALHGSVAPTPGQRALSAWFLASPSPARQETFTARCIVEVRADVCFKPDLVSHTFTSQNSATVNKSLVVERTWRAKNPHKCIPRVTQLPPGVHVIRLAENARPAQVEPGLWTQTWEITLAIKPTDVLHSRPSPEILRIEFHDSEASRVTSANLRVIIRRAFGVEGPKFIHFGTVPCAQTRTKKMLIRAADERDFQILRIETDSPAFTASAESTNPRIHHWLVATFRPEKDGLWRAQIALHTHHPDAPRLTISALGIGSPAN